MNASVLELTAMLVACGAAALAVLTDSPRTRYAAAAVALAAAPALVAGDVWDQDRFADLRDSPLLMVAALAAAGACVVALVLAFERVPDAFPVLALALVPFRVPVDIGGETSNLLVPLYLVIAAATVRGLRSPPGSAPVRSRLPTAARWLLWLLAASLVLYAVQAAYSEDVSNAIENACFFLVPFGVLFTLLIDVSWTRRLLGAVLGLLAAISLLFAIVAFWEYAARDLIFNSELLAANQLHAYFRVNSLFHDPNIFGRYLDLTVIALAAFVAWGSNTRAMVAATAVAVVAVAALVLTFSITSIVALVVGLALVALFRWGFRALAAAAVMVAIAGGVYLVANGTDSGRGDITEGRVDLVSGGAELAGDRPVWGWGSGSFGAAFEERIKRADTTTSHTEPITVAAEQGAIGLAVYLSLLAVAIAVFLRGARRTMVRAAIAACFGALLVHSLGYAGFVTDPATWALLALGVAIPPD